MRIVFFRRKNPLYGQSIDQIFDVVQNKISQEATCFNYTLPCNNTGIICRIKNMWFAWRNRGSVNHIIGDIHFLGIVLPKKSTILTVHDCGELSKQRGFKRLLIWLFWFYLPVKKLRYITAVSYATKRRILNYVKTNDAKIEVIHNGLLGNFTSKGPSFNTTKPKILFVGNTPNKNLERVILAIEKIECTLVILGNPGKEQMNLLEENKIQYCLKINLTTSEVIELYKECDLLLYPSTIEGFGLPIIEAQSSALPVITSNISSMPEIAGDGACYVNPFDISSIREALIRVISDESYRSDLVRKGLENATKYSSETMARKYLQLYSKVIEANT